MAYETGRPDAAADESGRDGSPRRTREPDGHSARPPDGARARQGRGSRSCSASSSACRGRRRARSVRAGYVNDGFTIDFDEWSEPFPHPLLLPGRARHEFDAILRRLHAKDIPFRSNVQGPVDNQVNTQHGGRIVYWNEPDGHYWEMLTHSYARRS